MSTELTKAESTIPEKGRLRSTTHWTKNQINTVLIHKLIIIEKFLAFSC